MKISTILAALALNGDNSVAPRAIQLAEQHGARLIVVHGIEDLDAGDTSFPLPTDREAVGRVLEANARERLDRVLGAAGVTTDIVITARRPHQLIEELTAEHGAELIVIGPGQPRTLRERMLGSTADRVVRTSPCPVLVARTAAGGPYRHIVAAVDFSPSSYVAMEFAAEIAPAAMLDLVHALEIPLSFQQAMLTTGTSTTEMDRYRRAKVQSATEQLLTIIPQVDASHVRRQVIEGPAPQALLRFAKDKQADLIVLGSQGKGMVSRMLLGSVTQWVVSAATCDVLVVP